MDTYRLEEIMREIEDLREEGMSIVSESRKKDGGLTYERAYRGWSAEIETALSKHNQWLGQIADDTLEETIDACKSLQNRGLFPEKLTRRV